MTTSARFLSIVAMMRSAAARQVLTMEAMRIPTVKYIFYVDDDTLIPAMGLYQLFGVEVDGARDASQGHQDLLTHVSARKHGMPPVLSSSN